MNTLSVSEAALPEESRRFDRIADSGVFYLSEDGMTR